jgi:hypothetical protein
MHWSSILPKILENKELIIKNKSNKKNYICERMGIKKEKLFKILNKACISSLELITK